MKRLISLGEAFARVLEIEDRALGVSRASNPRGFPAPTDARIAKILSQLPHVKIYGERRRKLPGEVRDIIHYPGGGSVEILETDLPIENPYQSSEVPQLSEISMGKAHLWLMRELQAGRLHAWGQARVESIGQPDSVLCHRTMIPVEIWTEQRRIRKKGMDDPAMPAPLPDYSTSSLRPVVNAKTGKTEEFTNIEVDVEELEAHFEEPIAPASVRGGVFRVVRKAGSGARRGKNVRCLVQVKYANHEVYLKSSRGLAAIGLLLGQPGEPMGWEMLHNASKLFRNGTERDTSIKFRNRTGETYDLRPGNTANLDGVSEHFDDNVVVFDDNIRVTSGRIISDRTSKEVQWLESQLNSLRTRADRSSGVRRTKLLEEIQEVEQYISKTKNEMHRSSGAEDGHRQAIYHEIESALTLLVVECPALAGHLGTLHKQQRRRLQTNDGGIVYNPGFEATWVTEPLDI